MFVFIFKTKSKQCLTKIRTACWFSSNAFVSGTGDLRFKSRPGEIGHNVANGSPPLLHFLKRAVLLRYNDAEMAQQTCNTLRGNTASIMMEIKFVGKIDLVKKKLNDEKARVYICGMTNWQVDCRGNTSAKFTLIFTVSCLFFTLVFVRHWRFCSVVCSE